MNGFKNELEYFVFLGTLQSMQYLNEKENLSISSSTLEKHARDAVAFKFAGLNTEELSTQLIKLGMINKPIN